ncbi:MAG: RutC protein [Spirochaetes bacterium]|nr:RutC protein [Spirochaetota bacterium]
MKKKISTKQAPSPVGPYSQAVWTSCGNLIFISGQIGIDPKTNKMVEGGIKEQTNQVMKNILSILNKQDLTIDHLIRCEVYLTNMEDFNDFNEEYGKFFPQDTFPARSAVEVSKLPKGSLIEISAIAGV